METSTEIETKAAPTGAELRKRGKAGNSLRRPVERERSVRPTRESVRYEDLAADLLDHYLISEKKSLVRKKNGHTCVPGEPHLRRFSLAGVPWTSPQVRCGSSHGNASGRERPMEPLLGNYRCCGGCSASR